MHQIFMLIPIVYVVISIAIIVFVYRWMTKVLALKQEQNDLLREVVRKMDSR